MPRVALLWFKSAVKFTMSCGERLRLLVLSDVSLPSASKLAEYFLFNSEKFKAVDLIVVAGNVNCQGGGDWGEVGGVNSFGESDLSGGGGCDDAHGVRQRKASDIGVMSGILSQLETIVCRVLYVPGERDPVEVSVNNGEKDCMRLTPNSRNASGLYFKVCRDLGVIGYEERRRLNASSGKVGGASRQRRGGNYEAGDVWGSFDELLKLEEKERIEWCGGEAHRQEPNQVRKGPLPLII